ncbi:hypothetical protein OSTOST_03679, partial [Ostertagia ostertagi]
MKRVKEFRTKLGDATTPRKSMAAKTSKSNGAMISLLPFHPKSVAAAKENEEQAEEFSQAFERFRFDLLATLKGQNRIIKHELCSALKILESVIRHIADSNVHYRMLMAVNIFKNVKDKISDGERDQAKAGLFPSPDSYVEDTTKLVAEVIAQIRSIIGMKQLHEAIAFSWNVARSSNKSPDPVIVGSAEQIPKGKPSEVTENVINLTLSALEMPSLSHMTGEETSRICFLDELQWNNSEVEQSFETSASPVIDELCEETPLDVEEPCSSSRGARLNCADVAQSLRTFFPENYETLAKHLFDLLASERTNEELQGELIDLLGFDHFEMVGGILESRSQLINELNASRHEATKLSSYAPEK